MRLQDLVKPYLYGPMDDQALTAMHDEILNEFHIDVVIDIGDLPNTFTIRSKNPQDLTLLALIW